MKVPYVTRGTYEKALSEIESLKLLLAVNQDCIRELRKKIWKAKMEFDGFEQSLINQSLRLEE